MTAITVFGIKNCDTMKKARVWLDAHDIEYHFHDYKLASVERTDLETWCKQLGWEVVLNRAGTTFRQLPEDSKTNLTERKAIELMLKQPSMIKRPVLQIGTKLLVGFKSEIYAETFSQAR